MGFFTKDVEPSVLELHDLDALVNDGGVAKPIPLSKAPPFTVVPMAASEELEIVLQLCVWCFAALSPLVALAWLVWSRCSLLSVLFALAVAAASTYPHPIRVCDPTRLSNPIRNMKAAAAFIRYFSFRMVVEDLDSLTKLEGAKLFAGVPHGLWPVGVALLGYCWWFLPFGLIRAGTASIVLRLPVWRQVTLWNGGIPVDRHSLWRALMKGDNCLVAADGIAGMFAAQAHPRKEVFLLRRRRGLVRLALQTGVPIVPFVCFHNTTIVKPLADPWGLLRRASRLLGVSIILPAGRFLTPLPFRKPVTVCIGKALEAQLPVAEPSDELIDKVHAKLINELVGLYHRHRERCGFGGVELAVV